MRIQFVRKTTSLIAQTLKFMKTLILQTACRLMASLIRKHASCFEPPDGMKGLVTPVFQSARHAGWKVGAAALTAPLPCAWSFNFARWTRAASLALVLLMMTAAHAQPTVQWATVAGTPGEDTPYDMALSAGGEIYVAGTFDIEGDTGPQVVLYKFDLNGTQTSSQASRGELIRGVAVDAKGNYYLTGRVWDPSRLGTGVLNDFYLAKYSSTGTLLWERATGSAGSEIKYSNDGGKRIALDAAGNIYVAGKSTGAAVFGQVNFPAAPGGPLLCKYDPDGALLWVKRVEGAGLVFEGTELGGGQAFSMALDRDGNVIMDGGLPNGPADFGGTVVNGAEVFVAKYKATGEVQWVRPGYGGGYTGGVAVDSQNNVFFTGMRWGKFTASGELVWARTIPGIADWTSVAVDGKDEPIFTTTYWQTVNLDGHVLSNPLGEILVCKADASGKFQWAVGGSGGAPTRGGQVVSDRAGNIYVSGDMSCSYPAGIRTCGTSSTFGSFSLSVSDFGGSRDFFLARLNDPSGVAVELKIARTASGLALSWPASITGFVLESAGAIPAPAWNVVPGATVVEGGQNVVNVEAGGSAKFFRLKKP